MKTSKLKNSRAGRLQVYHVLEATLGLNPVWYVFEVVQYSPGQILPLSVVMIEIQNHFTTKIQSILIAK